MPNTALARLDTVTEPAIAGGGLSEFGIQEVGTLQFGTTRTLSRVGTCRAPATASTLGKREGGLYPVEKPYRRDVLAASLRAAVERVRVAEPGEPVSQ